MYDRKLFPTAMPAYLGDELKKTTDNGFFLKDAQVSYSKDLYHKVPNLYLLTCGKYVRCKKKIERKDILLVPWKARRKACGASFYF